MPRRPKITPHALAVVQRLKTMLRDADRRDDLSLVHRIPVISPLGGASTVFTVEVTPGQNGRWSESAARDHPPLGSLGSSY
jgi:hypothetical protein